MWGAYVLAGEADRDESDNVDVTFKKPSGEAGPLNTVIDTDARDKSWIASVSFPMEF